MGSSNGLVNGNFATEVLFIIHLIFVFGCNPNPVSSVVASSSSALNSMATPVPSVRGSVNPPWVAADSK